MSATSTSINTFSLNLYQALPKSGNLFFSPFSIGIALAILMLGARANSADALAKVLHLSRDAAPQELRSLLDRIALIEVDDMEWDETSGECTPIKRKVFQLHTANGVFPNASCGVLKDDYRATLANQLGAHIAPLDFSDPTAAAQAINLWISTQTEGRIDQLVSAKSFSEATRLMLVNTIYFFAEWQTRFEEYATRSEAFHVGQDTTVQVDMMHDTLTLDYVADAALGVQAICLPYREADMLLLLPQAQELDALENKLTTLDGLLSAMKPRLIALSLPKFTDECSLELGEVLQAMGLENLFDPMRADFSGITSDPAGLVLSAIMHKACIKLDENGTEASAATLVAMAAGCSPEEQPQPLPFIVDRPFMYVIRDRTSGTILFAGRMVHPK